MIPRLVIAGVASGVGKTTLTTGLIAAFARGGKRVQPFKVGPDYIDPSYHAVAAGRPSRNLDTWLLPPATVQALFARAVGGADLAIIEGVMGLYDGHSGGSEAGSTAEVAKLLGAPVILVIDAGKMARSAGALALGYQRFDPDLPLAAIVFNNVAGPRHFEMVAQPVREATGLPVLGYLPRESELTLPERHLGLVPTVEGPAPAAYFDRLAARVREFVDLETLWRIAATSPPLSPPAVTGLFPAEPPRRRVPIAIAQDRAFSFYYPDSLDLLAAWGAELLPFSPIGDAGLPPGAAAIYLGGGFPEIFAAELAANRPIRMAVLAAARQGLPIYAECGGLMYLGEAITDFEGKRHAMTGILPFTSSMTSRRLKMGYRTVTALRDTLLLPAGAETRGHEFHWSALDLPPEAETAAYRLAEPVPRWEGFASASLLASYIHLHLATRPEMIRRWLDHCTGPGRPD